MIVITDYLYRNLLQTVNECGDEITTRNAITKSCCDLDPLTFTCTPLVTLRKTAWKMALREMEWFMSGDTKCPDELLGWWKEQLGYGAMYRGGYSHQYRRSGYSGTFDQIKYLLDGLRNNPNSRRLVMTTWNPSDMAHITELNNNPLTPSCCLPGYVNVICERRGLITFDDLSIGDRIWDGGKFVAVTNKWCNGYMNVFNYKTSSGSISCTSNHKVVGEAGKVSEIKDCKRINVIKGNSFTRLPINWKHVKNGLVLGDGTSRTKKNGSISYVLHIGEMDYDYLNTPIADMVTHYDSVKYDRSVYGVCYDYGELKKTYDREMPKDVFNMSRSEMCDFLLGLFSANGTVRKTDGSISLSQTSEKLIQQVQLLLNYLGIRSTIASVKGREIKFRNGTYKTRVLYNLNIIKKDINVFVENIGFIQKYKLDKLKQSKCVMDRNNSLIRESCSEGYHKVYDITVDSENHTFWCNGFNVSNCHGSMINLFVREGRVYMTHYQRSADLLLGFPHNAIQYWALLMYFARHSGLEVGALRVILGDAHIYLEHSHTETVKELLQCLAYPEVDNSFNLCYNQSIQSQGVPEFNASDFVMEGVIPEPRVLTKPKLL